MSSKYITIKIGGEAGFGIKVAGSTLGKVFSRMGYELFDYTEYPSLIRGGHNTFEVTIGEKVSHHLRPVNVLIALNQRTLDEHSSELSDDAGVIYDPERVNPADSPFNLYPVPLSAIAKEVHGSDLLKNTVALGAALALLNVPVEGLLNILKETFAKKTPEIINSNLEAAKKGYEHVKQQKLDFHYSLEAKQNSDRIYLTGNEAVALGAIAGGCRAYFGYPMTPSSSVLVYLAKHGPKVGLLVRQPEDEISVLNSAIGAGWAGVRSMVGTSGGGFSLMTEALGLAGITETSVVIFVAQRPGPATGLPTWSSQGDLRFVMHAAQDEFPRVIIAPGDHEEAFYETARAFNIAEKYQLPVFVMSDKNLAESGKTVQPFDQGAIKIERGEWLTEEQLKNMDKYLRYKLTDSGVSPRALVGSSNSMQIANSDEHDEYGYNNESVENRNAQMEKRMRKLQSVLKELPDPVLSGNEQADLTLVSWGSVKGSVRAALENLQGYSVNHLHFTYLWPFPTENAKKLLLDAKRLLVIESNYSGQFTGLIKEHIGRQPELHMRKYDGRPFWPHEIAAKVKEILSDKNAR